MEDTKWAGSSCDALLPALERGMRVWRVAIEGVTISILLLISGVGSLLVA
jgi:hypothetical protein